MMPDTNTNRTITFLSNEPCHEDAFEGHSHQNIASQIARLIKEDKNRHIIGIDGGWGSGKSNLISLVNKNLNGDSVYDGCFDHKESPYPFFIYDAWGHQSDYQRRAILEELTRDLTIEKKILDSKKWESKLEDLLAKRRKTTTKEVPSLGIGLVISIVLTMMTPLIVYVVGLFPENQYLLRVTISVFPYVAGLCIAVFGRIKSLKKHGQECTVSNILKELLLVYKDQIKENETYTTVSEKEPSSAEFKKWMDEIDADLKNLNQTLVIVFDNMDRLPSRSVESLWSSIHSFFSDKTYDNIRVLIPFDRKHVQNAFKNEDSGAKASGESYGNDFINKTFDVVFRVPPPIMTGWQQYMADMWKRAFGKDASLDISVTQIYEALSKNHTPRKIIAFINEVATVKMTMRDDIPDKYIALFVFGKEDIEKDPVGQLLNPGFMKGVKFEYDNDPDTIKYLSALYYQLPVEKALDVVFTREAAASLEERNPERLHEMKQHIDLAPILSKAILNVSNIENVSLTLAELDADYGVSEFNDMPNWLRKIWRDLYNKALAASTAWNEIKEYHVLLFQHVHDGSFAEKIITGYLSIHDDNLNVGQYVDAIDKLRANNNLIDKKLKDHKRKASPKLFLELLKHTKGEYETYGFSYDVKEFDAYLSGLEMQEVISVDVLMYLEEDAREKMKKTDDKLREWIGDSAGEDIETIKALFSRLKEVNEKPVISENLLDDGNIHRCWNKFVKTADPFKYDLLAMRLIRQDSYASQYSDSYNDMIKQPSKDDIEGLANVMEYYTDYGDLLLQSKVYKEYPIVVAVVKELTENTYGDSRAEVMKCLAKFDRIVDDYALEPSSLYKCLEGWGEYAQFNSTNILSMPSNLYETASVIDGELTDALHNACDTYFGSLSQDQWKEHVLANDGTFRIWKLYHSKKYQDNFDALKSVLKDYANGLAQKPDSSLIDEWLAICLEVNHSVKELFNDIASILKQNSTINKEKLLFFGAYILDYSEADKQKDFISKLIPTEIIDADVIGFIAEHIERLKECDLPDDFKEKVRHLTNTSMKEDPRIVVVCKNMGIGLEETVDD